jgi:hypothetical protein
MPDFLPVPPTNAITDRQVRSVLDALAQNIQVSIDKFSALNTTNNAVSSSKGGLNTFGTGVNAITNSTNLSPAYTKANALADLAVPLSTKLNKSAADILSGPIDFYTYGGFKTSGMTIASDGTATGQGVAFTSKGIVGRNSTTTTFTIDSTTGNATFGGTLTAATGTFYGDIVGGANINISGNAIFNGAYSSSGFTYAVVANPSYNANGGVIAYANGIFQAAVLGKASVNAIGGLFQTTGSQAALQGYSSGTGDGLYVSGGTMSINNNTLVTNLHAQYANILVGSTGANQLTFNQGTLTGSSTASFAANKPGGNSTNVWIQVTIDSTTLYIPVWT